MILQRGRGIRGIVTNISIYLPNSNQMEYFRFIKNLFQFAIENFLTKNFSGAN